ncbi:MAG TPA: XdhC family protein [Symbiobacteriaceae bacterium]|nr:XdhC family protein [Symbiobacteriaceae bacterium]
MDNAYLELAKLAGQGRKAVLATVVRGRGSTYRKPGSSAVVTDTHTVLGAISGGCMELDMLAVVDAVCEGGPARLLSYDTGSEEDLVFGTGSGCGGLVDVLVAPVALPVLDFVAARVSAGAPVVVATAISGGTRTLGRRLAVDRRGLRAGDLGDAHANAMATAAAATMLEQGEQQPAWIEDAHGVEYLLQPVLTPPLLLVAGAGDDARPVVELAKLAGFRVAVSDHRPAWLTPERFPGADHLILDDGAPELALSNDSYAVIITHHFERDLQWLKRLLAADLRYVGLLGARKRSQQLVDLLVREEPDLARTMEEKLYAPVGLDIGADGPQQIALSIIAEILAVRQGRTGTSLRRVREALTCAGPFQVRR